MIELRLMEDRDIEPASDIVIRAHDTFYEQDPGELRRLTMPGFRRAMAKTLIGGPYVYVLGCCDGQIAGVYQLPRFYTEGDEIVSGEEGYFATLPTAQGTGGEMLQRLAEVFPQVALDAGAKSLLHRETIRKDRPVRLFERHGYTRYKSSVTIGGPGGIDYHFRQRRYAASSPELTGPERKIVREIISRIDSK